MPRIILIHPYRPSMPPIEQAFAKIWPEAETLSLLDEALYSDVAADGTMAPSVPGRVKALIAHAANSGADAAVFTGSTFGPAVDAARIGIPIPVLKADEAMVREAVSRGGRILLVCTARRAAPIIEDNIADLARKMDKRIDVTTLVVPEAKAALVAGDKQGHDRLVAEAIAGQAIPDTVILGQISMTDILDLMSAELSSKAISSPIATANFLKKQFQ